jgi:hypothetical protein
MDTSEVAAYFGVAMSSIQLALSQPDKFPSLAARLPAPMRKIGRSWVWRRVDIERASSTQEGQSQ